MDDHMHHQGLAHDLARAAIQRRQLLRLFGGAVLVTAVACVTDDDANDDSSGGDPTGDDPTGGSGGTCTPIPEETAGPYPGDGSNGANALVLAGIVRSDIRSSFAGVSGTAEGVPLTITLTLVDESCAPLAGHAVYLWHCDRAGSYSMYSGSSSAQNYLRGVQETDADGKVTFQSIFPACYSGRWPHIHFEVYASLADISDAGNKIATSQLALPEAACAEVFAVEGYEASVSKFSQTAIDTDNVFSDGASSQLAEVTGDASGYAAALTVVV